MPPFNLKFAAWQDVYRLKFNEVDLYIKFHINQKEAAEYFGGGVNGFSRYERGESPPPRSLSGL